jgi:SnoaL-like protein
MVKRPGMCARTARDIAEHHVRLFNAAVRSGDWTRFLATFTDDATMSFVDRPDATCRSRDEIAAAYTRRPPTDAMTVEAAVGGLNWTVVRFRWTGGTTWHGTGGQFRLRTDDGPTGEPLIAELVITLDRVPAPRPEPAPAAQAEELILA